MKKKPYNDNLVMASIESLYNQANDSVSPADAGIKRQDPDKLPIVGSLPVTISDKTTDKTDDHLDDMVLTGLLDTVLVEQTAPAELARGDDTSDNPFLATVRLSYQPDNPLRHRPYPNNYQRAHL